MKHLMLNGIGTDMNIKLEAVFICHGMAKLKDDPGLCKLEEIAFKGYLAGLWRVKKVMTFCMILSKI